MTVRLLEVFKDRDTAYDRLSYYAETVVNMGLAKSHGVYVAPVLKHKTQGTWGVYLKRRDNE